MENNTETNQNTPNNSNNQKAQKSAIQAFAETFGSLREMSDLFDEVLVRLMWAYTGQAQTTYNLVGDYDFIHAIRKAIKADLKGLNLNFTSEPSYPPLDHPTINPPKVSNAAQALKIAEAKGIKDFRVTKVNDEYVLLTNWTQAEVTAYHHNYSYKLWGSFSDEGVFMIRFLHLMAEGENDDRQENSTENNTANND
jgi:hypothetical protein